LKTYPIVRPEIIFSTFILDSKGEKLFQTSFSSEPFPIFLSLITKMDPRNIRSVSKKRSAPSPDKEFRFQPEPERSDKGHESLRLRPRVRTSVILAALSGEKEKRRSPHKSPYFTPFRDFQDKEVALDS
jgi:hypothetical protein